MIASEQDVMDAVRDARGRTFEIVAGGSKRTYGRPARCDTVLNVAGLNGIVKYEPEELVLTVRPATKVAEIAALLEEKHQRLGFDPADWGPLLGAEADAATIGGVLSADTNG
ncbi:MAG TPA: FAD-binding protein, partial [Rhizomicrobium sp.]|nr:FAD-binding protein [Rhizomicrobium sp.]